MAKNSNGEYRLCVNYRELIKITVPLVRPIPHIEDLVAQVGSKKFFTRIDLKDAFFHVFVEKSSIKFTAFITHSGQFKYLVALFGHLNSLLTFAEFIVFVFRELIRRIKVFIFFDDAIILTDTIEKNIVIIEECFKTVWFRIKVR